MSKLEDKSKKTTREKEAPTAGHTPKKPPKAGDQNATTGDDGRESGKNESQEKVSMTGQGPPNPTMADDRYVTTGDDGGGGGHNKGQERKKWWRKPEFIITTIVGLLAIISPFAFTSSKTKVKATVNDFNSVVSLKGWVTKLEKDKYQGFYWKWYILSEDGRDTLYKTGTSNDFYTKDIPITGFGRFTAIGVFTLSLTEKKVDTDPFWIPPPSVLPIKANDGKALRTKGGEIKVDMSGGISISSADSIKYKVDSWVVEGEDEPFYGETLTLRFVNGEKRINIYVIGKTVESNHPLSNSFTLVEESQKSEKKREESMEDVVPKASSNAVEKSQIRIPSLDELSTVDSKKLSALLTNYANSGNYQEFYQNEQDILDAVVSLDIPVKGFHSLADLLTQLKMSFEVGRQIRVLDFSTTTTNRVSSINSIVVM